jgi:hypothetical protein
MAMPRPFLNAYILPTASVPEFWDMAEPHLRRVLRFHPFMRDTNDILALLMEGLATLVVYTERGEVVGAAVMEIHAYPSARVANILALSGRPGFLKRIKEAEATLQHWSRQKGCASMSMLGRPGWAKTVGALGYSQRPTLTAWKTIQQEPA